MDARDRFGGWSALLALLALAFNLALVTGAFAAAQLAGAVVVERAYDHHETPATEALTRRAVERTLAGLADPGMSGADGWIALVGRELVAGDVTAARGFLLSAETILPPPDATRLAALLKPSAGEAGRADAAFSFLPADMQRHFESLGGPYGGGPPPAALGDEDDFASMAAAAARGEPVDRFTLELLGFALAAPNSAEETETVTTGAALLRAARRAGALSPAFAATVEEAMARAAPPQRVDAAFAEAAGAASDAQPNAASEAFLRALDPAGSAELKTLLIELAALSEAAGPTVAIRLTPFAETPADLTSLRLLAAGGRERAVAAAKYISGREALLALPPKTLALSPEAQGWGALAAAAFVAAFASLLATFWALRRRAEARLRIKTAPPRAYRARPDGDVRSPVRAPDRADPVEP